MKKLERIEKRRKIRDMQKKKKTLEDQLAELEGVEAEDEIIYDQLDEVSEEPEPVVPDVGDPEPAQKDMGGMGMDYQMPPMPKSWDELDQLEQAQEQAKELRELGWDVQDLVYNIITCGDMTPADKASAIQDVGSGFQTRVESVIATGEEDPTEKEMDLLSLDAIQAHDARQITIKERVVDMIDKAKLNAKRENALQDSQFALVRNEGGKKVRKYPIHDKAHVRNALARAAQMISAGGPAARDARAALPKIRAAAKRMGIEVSTKKENNSLLVEKDASGQWRWVGWVTNNFIDTDEDIFCEEAHKEYVEWLDKNMDVAPAFVTWHTPGTVRESPADFASFENGFLIMSGKLTEEEASGLLKARKETEIGMSHGTFVLGRDPNDPRVVTKYRMYEVSDLPLDRAANPFTAVETITKEVDMDKQKYLAAILGSEEKAKAFLEKTGIKQKELQEAGVEHKEKVEEQVPPAAPVAQAVDTTALIEQIKKEFGIDDLNAWVAGAQEALDKVITLEELVKELSRKDEDKVADLIAPPIEKYVWLRKQRPSEASGTKMTEDDPINKEAPQKGWLSEVTGTNPVKIS